VDIFQKCADAAEYYARIREAGVYPYYRAISSGQDPVVTHLGKELIMLGSNNYLGLTNHPEVKEAAAVALAMFGTGCAGSRLLNGTLDIHLELEERALVFAATVGRRGGRRPQSREPHRWMPAGLRQDA
jgi:7-keto-8-aminopelargonate synthetase-like enzyme